MKAAVALSRASEFDVKSKDQAINQLQNDLCELKRQLCLEVIKPFLYYLLLLACALSHVLFDLL